MVFFQNVCTFMCLLYNIFNITKRIIFLPNSKLTSFGILKLPDSALFKNDIILFDNYYIWLLWHNIIICNNFKKNSQWGCCRHH